MDGPDEVLNAAPRGVPLRIATAPPDDRRPLAPKCLCSRAWLCQRCPGRVRAPTRDFGERLACGLGIRQGNRFAVPEAELRPLRIVAVRGAIRLHLLYCLGDSVQPEQRECQEVLRSLGQ